MSSIIANHASRLSITPATGLRAAGQRITLSETVRDLRTGNVTTRKTRLDVHAALRRAKPFVDEQVARLSPIEEPEVFFVEPRLTVATLVTTTRPDGTTAFRIVVDATASLLGAAQRHELDDLNSPVRTVRPITQQTDLVYVPVRSDERVQLLFDPVRNWDTGVIEDIVLVAVTPK